MRIYSKINGLSNVDYFKLQIEVEKTKMNVLSILPLLRDFNFVYSGTAPAITFEFFLDAPFQIQSVIYDGLERTFDVIKDDGNVVYKNFVANVQVNEFQGKKNYLIPLDSGAVTDIMPKIFKAFGFNKNTGQGIVLSASHYLYISVNQMQVRNGDSFTGIIFDVDNDSAAKELLNTHSTSVYLASNLVSPKPISKSNVIQQVQHNLIKISNFQK